MTLPRLLATPMLLVRRLPHFNALNTPSLCNWSSCVVGLRENDRIEEKFEGKSTKSGWKNCARQLAIASWAQQETFAGNSSDEMFIENIENRLVKYWVNQKNCRGENEGRVQLPKYWVEMQMIPRSAPFGGKHASLALSFHLYSFYGSRRSHV